MKDLGGQVAIVTGGAAGIGKGIASVLAREGARVVIADIDLDRAEASASELSDTGLAVIAVRCDVTSREDTEALASRIIRHWGKIDILAANAGIFPQASLDSMSDEDWDRVQDINVKGMLHAVQACLPNMTENGYGRIVLTSSITGPITGYPGWAHYGASKAAMLGFMRTAAVELAPRGITVNAVQPGNIQTEGLADLGEAYLNEMAASIPAGRLGSVEDIGYAVRMLAAPESGYITGHAVVVDGGQTLPESMDALNQGGSG